MLKIATAEHSAEKMRAHWEKLSDLWNKEGKLTKKDMDEVYQKSKVHRNMDTIVAALIASGIPIDLDKRRRSSSSGEFFSE